MSAEDEPQPSERIGRGWRPGTRGSGLVIAEGHPRPHRLVAWTRGDDGRPHPADVQELLEVPDEHIAAIVNIRPSGVFTLMLGLAGPGPNDAPLRELVARLDQRLRPASRWDPPS